MYVPAAATSSARTATTRRWANLGVALNAGLAARTAVLVPTHFLDIIAAIVLCGLQMTEGRGTSVTGHHDGDT